MILQAHMRVGNHPPRSSELNYGQSRLQTYAPKSAIALLFSNWGSSKCSIVNCIPSKARPVQKIQHQKICGPPSILLMHPIPYIRDLSVRQAIAIIVGGSASLCLSCATCTGGNHKFYEDVSCFIWKPTSKNKSMQP